MTLETVAEECEEETKNLNVSYQISTVPGNEIRLRRNSDLDKSTMIEPKSSVAGDNLDAVEDSTKAVSEVTLQNSRDVHFGNTIFTAPITVVNHHIGKSVDGDIEYSCDGRSTTISDRSRRCSTVAQKRLSIASDKFSGKHIWFGVTIATFIIMTTIIAVMMITWPKESSSLPLGNPRPEFYINESWFVHRDKWFATPPKRKLNLTVPVQLVITGDTNSYECHTKTRCIIEIRKMQDKHMKEQALDDIAYNFIVCGKGIIFEGRGPYVVGEHTKLLNQKSIFIAYMGRYNNTSVPPIMNIHIREFFDYLIESDIIREEYFTVNQYELIPLKEATRNWLEKVFGKYFV